MCAFQPQAVVQRFELRQPEYECHAPPFGLSVLCGPCQHGKKCFTYQGLWYHKRKKTLKKKGMKSIGNLWDKMCSMETLRAAEAAARKGKGDQYGVRVFDRDPEGNLSELRDMLYYKEYTTGPYKTFMIRDPKEREVFALPYYPHRIVQHAALIAVEPEFRKAFTADTFNSIKGRGLHKAVARIKSALQDYEGAKYCLKIDVRKFYPSVDHDILKSLIRKKVKDPGVLWLLDDIIESAPGVPIGNAMSQPFANFYLTYFDHWVKGNLRVKHYFRYSDDIVILSGSKPQLHEILSQIRAYLWNNLKLQVKDNYQVFPVEDRGIDVLGHVIRRNYIRMRKSIKQRLARAVARKAAPPVIAGHLGWAKHCNSRHLLKKLKLEVA